MTVGQEINRFVQFIADDNCRGDRGSAWVQATLIPGMALFLFCIFLGAIFSGVWQAILVFGLGTGWLGYEVYHMVMGYAAHITGNKAFKFHWSMRWRAYMYKEHATKAYFVEYQEWLHGQDPSWYNL